MRLIAIPLSVKAQEALKAIYGKDDVVEIVKDIIIKIMEVSHEMFSVQERNKK